MKSNSAKRLDELMQHFGINQSDMVKKPEYLNLPFLCI